MTRKWSRRQFLNSLGMTAGAAMLANMGLPAAMAQDDKFRGLVGLANGHVMSAPEVELIVGDVLGFQLSSNAWDGAFGSVTFRMHTALYNGEQVYYIRTDASDADFAATNRLVHVPLLASAVRAEGATRKLYTFENGVDEQFPVVDDIPNTETYSSAWQVHTVTFNGDASFLDSAAAIEEAASAGDVAVEATNIVVNFPIVKWVGGELQEDTEKVGYLGTGPLISPVNTDDMTVTFKLHECYPGSRYIVTDTSAAPMAPMMAIAASSPTQGLVDVGATDEIWVFGNGIEGSGVMGFQPAIFDNAAGNPIWSPFWNHFTAVWENPDEATLVTTSAELRALVDSGALTIFNGTPDTDPQGFVVNCPVPIKAANTFSVS